MKNVYEQMEDIHAKENIAAFLQKQALPYEAKKTAAKQRVLEYYHEMCNVRNANVHVSVGGLDSITLFIFIRDYCHLDVPGISASILEDKSVQAVHKQLGIEDVKPIKSKVAVIKEFGFPILSKEIATKIELLQKNVLGNQKVRALKSTDWSDILSTILLNIYRYIDTDSSEGQDILNMFFIAFNKYTGKADKNQAFTPDHITEFMCRITGVDRTKRILDATCGSGSFLVQAMVKELADCRRGKTEDEANSLMEKVRKEHIYGIEVEEKAYGLSTTNMLIHGDGNSNIKFDSCFNCKDFIKTADPDIILMNPPYNAKPIGIPDTYKVNWGKAKDGKEDPTKGLVFVHYLSDIVEEMNVEREVAGKARKTVKMAVLLPVAAAIGNKNIIQSEKIALLENNTLEAVFTLPNEIFYPGASASACCMVFTLGEPHIRADGTLHETFFGYFKEDGFKKKKYLGRVEQFDENGNSKWKAIEEEWLDVFRNHLSKDGLSATAKVTGEDEWLCEAYMKTDYTTLREDDFQQTLNNYLAYLLKEGKIYES